MPKKDLTTIGTQRKNNLKNHPNNLESKSDLDTPLDKTIEHLDIKVVKKVLGLKDEDIARMFGYKNVMSYRNAKEGKKRLDSGIVDLYFLMKSIL